MDNVATNLLDLFDAEEVKQIQELEGQSKVLEIGDCFKGILKGYEDAEDHKGRPIILAVFVTEDGLVNMAMSTDLKQKMTNAEPGDVIGIQRLDDVIAKGSGQNVKQFRVVRIPKKGKKK